MNSADLRIVLVTGATRGLGLEVASRLAVNGHLVVLAGRDARVAEQRAAEIRARGGEATAIALNVLEADSVDRAAQELSDRFGRLDVLINNAGVMLDGSWSGNTAPSVSESVLRQTFDTNFFAVVRVTQALLPILRRGRDPHIVNVSSLMGSLTLHAQADGPLSGFKPFAYDASKAALNAFTTHLAEAVKPAGIRVNSVHPGWVRTELGTSAATLSVEDGARPIVDLARLRTPFFTAKFIQEGGELPW
ncbi:MAG: SDR family NAD(P)-dependent oxidoreductase [Myxococcota bacterium]